MKLDVRRYESEEDYWRIRQFLRDVFLTNGRRQFSWHVARWDYWRWPGVESWGDGPLEDKVAIWESPDGRICAVLNAEGPGDAFLQVHPDDRTPALEREMVDFAEMTLAQAESNGKRKLVVWVDSRDEMRQAVLRECGYQRGDQPEVQHCRYLAAPIEAKAVPHGYTVRALGDVDELPRRSWFSWRAFHPDEPEDNYRALGWEWYLDIQRCPLYRRDLDMVAVAPNGDIASFCTVWYDDVTRSAYIEPVGTTVPYRRQGLAQAVMVEGLRRVQHLGAKVAFVSGYSPEANRLYDVVMGEAQDVSERWVKNF